MDALEQFADCEDIMLVGSEAGEVVRGRVELGDFLCRIFERPETFTWDWSRVETSCVGKLAWIYGQGELVVHRGAGQKRAPYRLTGVFENVKGAWRWRHLHGSEPA